MSGIKHFPWRVLKLLVAGFVFLGFLVPCARAHVTIQGPVVEQKNWHAEGYIDFESHWGPLVIDWGSKVDTAVELNHEGVHGYYGNYYYNWYPGTITVDPDVTTVVVIPFLMMTSPTANGPGQYPYTATLAPLPGGVPTIPGDGSVVLSASMTGASGTVYGGTITSFFDVWTEIFIDPGCPSCLPLTGPHGEVYTWDTTVLDPSGRGNFFVARVAMPLGDLAVPEPAVLLLVGSGLLALGFARRRK